MRNVWCWWTVNTPPKARRQCNELVLIRSDLELCEMLLMSNIGRWFATIVNPANCRQFNGFVSVKLQRRWFRRASKVCWSVRSMPDHYTLCKPPLLWSCSTPLLSFRCFHLFPLLSFLFLFLFLFLALDLTCLYSYWPIHIISSPLTLSSLAVKFLPLQTSNWQWHEGHNSSSNLCLFDRQYEW